MPKVQNFVNLVIDIGLCIWRVRYSRTILLWRRRLRSEWALLLEKSNNKVIESLGGKPVDKEELRTLLFVKADKSDVSVLEKIKADRTLVAGYDASLDTLSSQISHLLTLFISYLKADLNCRFNFLMVLKDVEFRRFKQS